MRRPLIAVALLQVAGILVATVASIPLAALFGVAIALALLFTFWVRARLLILCVLIAVMGWINLARRTAVLSPRDLRTIVGNEAMLAEVRGKLLETPRPHAHRNAVTGAITWSSTGEIDVREIRTEGGEWQAAFGRIVATTSSVLPDSLFAGQEIELAGALQRARGPLAEGLFDYRAYLSNHGAYYELPVQSVAEWKVVRSPARPPLSDRFQAWARRTLAMGLPDEDESLKLEWALTLGWKPGLTDEAAEPFIRAATYHIFAVDGLRVAILSAILFSLFRTLSVPRAVCGILAAPLLLFYAAMTGWPASAIRAIVMVLIVFGGWTLKRPSDLINSLFAAATVILVWEPRELFQAGFQLSFFVVLCIILIEPFFRRIAERLLQPDPLLPNSLRPRWQKILHPPAAWLTNLFLASVAAWLGSIPLVAYYFHIITPLSGPANVLAVPLCGLVLVCNLSSLLLAAWFPYGSELFNHAGWAMMELIRQSSEWSANWPGAWFYLPMPSLFTIALYYALLLGLLTGWMFTPKVRRWKIAGFAAATIIWCGHWLWQLPETRLTILPLNGGHAIFARAPGWRNDWLVDCGNRYNADAVIKPFLAAQGVNRLEHLIVTHGEAGYSGGAQYVCELFHPHEVWLNPLRFRSVEYNRFVAFIGDTGTPQKAATTGATVGPFQVLYPGTDVRLSRTEDNPLVLRANINNVRILLLSDLSHAGQNALLNEHANDMRADIVVTGLPAESEPLSDALLDAIQPRAIIVADTDYPAQRRANLKLRQRLGERNVPVLYTHDTRAVTLTIRAGQWDLRAMEGTEISGASLPAGRIEQRQ